jgi:hypothetical protein
MNKKISKANEIIVRLRSEGKVIDLSNDPKFLKKVSEINKYMEEVHRDYLMKSYLSEQSAKNIYINC